MITISPWNQRVYTNAWARCSHYVTKELGEHWTLSDPEVVECFRKMNYNYECINRNPFLHFETEEDLLAFLLKWG